MVGHSGILMGNKPCLWQAQFTLAYQPGTLHGLDRLPCLAFLGMLPIYVYVYIYIYKIKYIYNIIYIHIIWNIYILYMHYYVYICMCRSPSGTLCGFLRVVRQVDFKCWRCNTIPAFRLRTALPYVSHVPCLFGHWLTQPEDFSLFRFTNVRPLMLDLRLLICTWRYLHDPVHRKMQLQISTDIIYILYIYIHNIYLLHGMYSMAIVLHGSS